MVVPLYIRSFVIMMIVTATTFSALSFCNKIEATSVIDISSGSVRSSFEDRFIHPNGSATDDFSYSLTVHQNGEEPAMGTVRASFELLIHEGDAQLQGLLEEIRFRENTRVSGTINSFEKLLKYQSN